MRMDDFINSNIGKGKYKTVESTMKAFYDQVNEDRTLKNLVMGANQLKEEDFRAITVAQIYNCLNTVHEVIEELNAIRHLIEHFAVQEGLIHEQPTKQA